MKSCSKCKIEKEFTLFHKSSRNKCGYRSQCISCENEYKEANKDKLKEYFKNRVYDPSIKKEYYLLNKERIKDNYRKYYENNKESKLEYQKEYQKNNKDKRNSYLIERRQNDPLFKLITNVRNLIYNSFDSPHCNLNNFGIKKLSFAIIDIE
jgi:hypothetical protein